MPRNLKLNFGWLAMRDKRAAMRLPVWALVALNLAAAAVTFTPLGGGSRDALRAEESTLRGRLTELDRRVQASRALSQKVDTALRGGDEFLNKYFMDARVSSSTLEETLNQAAKQAGVRALPGEIAREQVEGSDTLYMARITAGYEGTYANLKKLVELLDKSPRFLIVESMSVASPQAQAGQVVTVRVKMDAFVRDVPGAAL